MPVGATNYCRQAKLLICVFVGLRESFFGLVWELLCFWHQKGLGSVLSDFAQFCAADMCSVGDNSDVPGSYRLFGRGTLRSHRGLYSL